MVVGEVEVVSTGEDEEPLPPLLLPPVLLPLLDPDPPDDGPRTLWLTLVGADLEPPEVLPPECVGVVRVEPDDELEGAGSLAFGA